MNANFVTENGTDNIANEFSFNITSAKDEETACDHLMSGLYNLANQLEAHHDMEQARKDLQVYSVFKQMLGNI